MTVWATLTGSAPLRVRHTACASRCDADCVRSQHGVSAYVTGVQCSLLSMLLRLCPRVPLCPWDSLTRMALLRATQSACAAQRVSLF